MIERIVLGKRNVARIHRLLVVVQYEVGVQDCHTFFACIFLLSKTSELEVVYLRVYLECGFTVNETYHESLYVLSVLLCLITRIENLVMSQLVILDNSMT